MSPSTERRKWGTDEIPRLKIAIERRLEHSTQMDRVHPWTATFKMLFLRIYIAVHCFDSRV